MTGLPHSSRARLLPRFFWFFCAIPLLAGAAELNHPAFKAPLLLDLEPFDPFTGSKARLFAFIFARTDCPISNSYAPEIQRLQAAFAPRGVVFWLVYPGADESPEMIRDSLRAFKYSFGALRDPTRAFAKKAHVSVTPEAAVFGIRGELLYHGRIDDRYADFGISRPEAAHHDLAEALSQALAGKPVAPASGPAVGCFLEDEK